ncbi:MAG: ParB/RepB/Spo0J family partition protein [Flintibacter sp.]|uniref:ParB/RepB/Spo0J family partition protein n=1 Tax=Flintibacter sp. TaxID=1918624 RepID=UPI0026712F18|nr:ParB/RepB/Spo0J family partition protein [Flintibacter sp.]MCI6149976.1 ParB/RepB/Spo0J family partition protein [Flintibacter sp.]MDY5039080.1 ParB/RepB/Spo0J family partition protein [Lawsonibacter sp.]
MAETTTPKKRGRKAAAAGQPVKQEVVVMVPLAELHPFPDHPFQVRDDESMRETAASVKENGVIIPGLVRPREEGGYEIIAGHRRKHACELAGLTAMPVIVRDMDRDSATVVMVDSNLQRESILPSERAKAYKMKLDAIKRRAGRPSKDEQENAPNVSANFRSDDEVGQDAGVSGDTIRNYIALTQLVPELQKMVDDKKIALTPAYQLAALTPKEQALLLETIDSEQATPSLSQAQRMKKLSQSGELNEDTMLQIMAEQKKPERTDITLPGEKLRKYFPRSYTPMQIETTIFKLLDAWQRKRQREQSR